MPVAVEHVPHGTGPEVLAALNGLRDTRAGTTVSYGGGLAGDVAAVADVQPGGSTQAARAARLTVHRDAPADVLVRFGHLLGATAVPGRGSTRWLATLADGVVRAASSEPAAFRAVRTRWPPGLVGEVARVGDAFLARHADVLAEVVAAAAIGEQVVRLYREHRIGPVRLAALCGNAASTAHRILRRHGMPALDDHSCLARTEDLPGGKAATCSALPQRAAAWFAPRGVTVKRVLTDNAWSCTKDIGTAHLVADGPTGTATESVP
ncbi:hypothetical protein SUDANB176_00212 [Streptomyces sp. enrichment culture]